MKLALLTSAIVFGVVLGCVTHATLADPGIAPPDNGVHVSIPKAITPQLASPKLFADKAKYAPGQVVRLTFSITNPGKYPLSYSFSTTQQYDITISSSAGKAIWHWSKGRMFGQIVTKLALSPGQSKSYDITWNRVDDTGTPVPSGTYTVVATTTPMERIIVSGGIVMSSDRDPNNLGVPTKTDGDSGATLQTDGTPAVSAKITIVVL